jgi:hypothetical protein
MFGGFTTFGGSRFRRSSAVGRALMQGIPLSGGRRGDAHAAFAQLLENTGGAELLGELRSRVHDPGARTRVAIRSASRGGRCPRSSLITASARGLKGN